MFKNVSAKKLVNLAKYQIKISKLQIFINLGVLILNIIIAYIITKTVKSVTAGSGSLDAIYLIWALILGITFFFGSFKFAMLCGVSRKTYFLASAITMTLIPLMWAPFVTLFIFIAEKLNVTFTFYFQIYAQNYFSMFIWLFCSGVFMGVFGWFFSLVFYVANKNQRLIIAAALILAIPVFVLINSLTDGWLGSAAISFFKLIIGITSRGINSYLSSLSFTILSTVFLVFNFLLVRKAVIKD